MRTSLVSYDLSGQHMRGIAANAQEDHYVCTF